MPNQAAADHLATKLAEGLIHPGDGKSGPFVLPLSIFRPTGITPAMADHFATEAGLPHADVPKLTGEAAVHTLEENGWAIVDQTEIEQLRAKADAAPPTGQHVLAFTCAVCHNQLFRLSVDVNNPVVNGPYLLETLNKLATACPHTPEATA